MVTLAHMRNKEGVEVQQRAPRGTGERIRINLTLSSTTHRALKVWCASKQMTMQSGLEKILNQAFAKKAADLKETV
jgi:hypothetical protein